MFKLNLEKAEESEISCQHPLEIMENAREFQKKIYFCFITPKPLTVWVTTNYGKF